MHRLIGPGIVVAGTLYALDYIGPVETSSDAFVVKLFLWAILAVSTVSFVSKLLSLPFSKGK